MRHTMVLFAIVFGAMLAITGCGSDDGGGGNAGSPGSGGDFCDSLCAACGGGEADCQQACDLGFGSLPSEVLGACPNEFNTLTACFGANDCDGDACDAEVEAYTECVAMSFSR